MQSPCVQICVIDPEHKLCVGCGRSLGEIGLWSGYSDAQRARIMASLPKRMALYFPDAASNWPEPQ